MGKTREDYLKKVSRTGMTLVFVPESFKDKEMCLAAIKQDVNAIIFVPKNSRYKVLKEILSDEEILTHRIQQVRESYGC